LQHLIEKLLKQRWLIGVMIALIILIWGYAWVLMKEALDYMGPFTFSAFRFGTGTLTLFLILLLMKVGLPPRNQWKHLIILGILQTSIVFLLVMYGLEFVDAGKSSVLLYSMPIWSSLLASLILKEKPTRPQVLGLGMGVIGLIAIVGIDLFTNQSAGMLFGELLIIIAAISWGGANVYYRIHFKDSNQLQVTAYQMLFGTIGIIIAAFFMEGGGPVQLTPTSIYYILFTGVLASALCFTLWFFLLSKIDMVTATMPTLLVPVLGLTFGSLLLDEQLTTGVIIGTILILLGIGIAKFAGKTKSGHKDKS